MPYRSLFATVRTLLAVTILSLSSTTFAASGITYQGRILKPDGTPLTGANVQFKMQLRSPDANNCLMYEEMQALDMRNSNGVFAITINDGTGTRTDTSGYTLDKILSNAQGVANTFSFNPTTCSTGSSYTPNSGDGRSFVVYFKDETMAAFEPMPSQRINFVPFAFESKSVGGFTPASLVRVAEADGTLDSVSPLSNANYTELLNLINGTSNQYTKQSAAAGSRVTTASGNVATPSAGSMWLDTTAGSLKFYDGTTVKTVGTAGGSVTSVATGTGLTGGPITTTGTISLATLGAGGTGYKVTYDTYGRVTGAVALVEADIPTLTTAGHVSGSAITSGTIGGTTAINTSGTINSGAITSSGLITSPSLSSTAVATQSVQIFETTNSFKVTIQAPASLSANYALTLPTTAGGVNQVLTTNGSGVLSWTTPAGTGISALTGDVSASGSGSVAATVNSVGTSTAANIHSAELAANAATNLNTVSTIVKRDGSGNFAASAITQTSGIFKDSGANTITVSAPTTVTSSYVLKLPAAVASVAGQYLSSDTSGNLSWTTLPSSMAPSGAASGDLSGTYPGPTVATVGTSTAANIHSAELAANGAVSTNTASKIVLRDASGNFASNVATLNGLALNNAGSVLNITNPVGGAWNMTLPATAGTSGQVMQTNGSGLMSWLTLPTALPPNGAAGGDLSGTYPGPTVATVGTSTAANIHSAELAANAATNLNTASTIVKRDASGNFSAGTITSTALTTGAATVTSVVLKDSGSNTVTLSAPTTVTTSYSLKLPTAAGTAGQTIQTDASGNLSWATPATGMTSLTGDVTGSGAGAVATTISASAVTTSKIADANVTYQKIQNVSGPNIILGRASAGTGVVQEITLGTGLSLSGTTLNSNGLAAVTNTATLTNDKIWIGDATNKAQEFSLSGDATMTNGGVVTVSTVGTSTAANIHSAELAANAATAVNTASKIVLRDASGNFASNVATLNGLALNNAGSVLNIVNPVGGAWTMTLPATAGSSGQAMVTNGSGTMSWVTPLTSSTGFVNGGNSFGANASIGTNDAFRLDVKTNNAVAMTVDTAGKVGIGTTAPATKLSVAGTVMLGDGGETCGATYAGGVRYNGGNIQFCNGTAWSTLGVAGAGITALTGDVTASGSGSVAATVASVGGSTAANVHTAELAANAATNLNTVSTIVKRDGSGNFAAGAITSTSQVLKDSGANTVTVSAPTTVTTSYALKLPAAVAASAGQVLASDTSGNMSWSTLPTSLPPNGSAGGDLSGTYPNPTVATVGTSTAANIHSAELAANGAVSTNTASKIVLRDASGNFASNVITGNGFTLNNAGSLLNIVSPVGGAWTMTMPATAGSSGQVMQTNGSGVMTWMTPLTSSTGFINGGNSFGANASIGTNDVFRLDIKTNNAVAMTVDTTGKVGIGTTSPSKMLTVTADASINGVTVGRGNYAGGQNTALGSTALFSATSSSSSDTGVGDGALYSNTSGTQNTAVGRNAGYGVSTSGYNTAVGYNAIQYNNGGSNTAIGGQSMSGVPGSTGGQNTAVGYGTLASVSTGSNNVAIGYSAGFDVSSGSNNVILGYQAASGTGVTTGSNNVIIGNDVRPPSQTANNQLNIGNLLYGTGLSSGTTASTGNVGIGTTAPATKLQVAGSVMLGDGGETCGATYAGAVRYNGGNVQFCNGTAWTTLGVAGAGITALTGDVTASGSGSVAATVASVGGSTAANVHAAELAANAATDVNTFSTIVKRDASGGFTAGTINLNSANAKNFVLKDTGANTVTVSAPTTVTTSYALKLPAAVAASAGQVLASDTSGNMSWSTLPTALPPNGSAGGDLSGTYPNPTVATVGTSTAANIHSAELAANGAVSTNTASKIVLRDASGNFASNVITGNGFTLNNAGSLLNIVSPIGGAWTMTMPATAGSSGQVMQTNGSGVMTWVTPLTSATGFVNGGNSFGANASIGTNDAFRLDVKTNNAARMTIDSSGNVGIGTTAPSNPLEAHSNSNPTILVQDDTPTTNPFATLRVNNYRGTWGMGDPQIISYGSTGTSSSPGQTTTGMKLMSLQGHGNANVASGFGSDMTGASIEFVADTNWINSTIPTDITFSTAPTGTWSIFERMRITSAGSIGMGTLAPSGPLSVTPSQYATGTASQSLTTVTGVGTTWTSAMIGSQFVFANGVSAGTITAVGSATSLTVTTSQTVASQNYNIGYTGLQVTSTGNVGIGTTSPTALTDLKLPGAGNFISMHRSDGMQVGYFSTDNGFGNYFKWANNGGGTYNFTVDGNGSTTANAFMFDVGELGMFSPAINTVTFKTNSTERLRIDPSGNVGIGTTAPAQKLDVYGNIAINGTSICTSAGCTSSSDRTLKEHIQPLQNSLEKVLKLQGVEYDYKDKKKFTGQHQVGVIAQDVEKIYPEVVVKDSQTGLRAVAYDHLVGPLIEAFKSLYGRLVNVEHRQDAQDRDIASLKAENSDLKQQNAEMKARLEAIEKKLSTH